MTANAEVLCLFKLKQWAGREIHEEQAGVESNNKIGEEGAMGSREVEHHGGGGKKKKHKKKKRGGAKR